MLSRLLVLSQLGVLVTFASGAHGRYAKLPLSFESTAGEAAFVSRVPGYTLFVTPGGAIVESAKSSIRMSLEGANQTAGAVGLDKLPGRANYITGKDRSKWRTNVPMYGKVRYSAVYPGIDLVYYGNDRELEYDFEVAPGADPGRISLAFGASLGTATLSLDGVGDLIVATDGARLRMRKPVMYQNLDGKRVLVPGSFVLSSANRVSLRVGAYDRTRKLVVDPVLSYATYFGGADDDVAGARSGGGIAADASGNTYIVGTTNSANFPASSGSVQPKIKGDSDVFVAKLNSSGTAVLYATYIGGEAGDTGYAIAVDASGNAYIAGSTSSTDFPVSDTAVQKTHAGGVRDVFVTKLNPDGSALVYSTYLGGGGVEPNASIAVDSTGNAYVAGNTNSTNFPTTPGAFQTTRGGLSAAFVTKLNDSGSGMLFSTYLGGTGGDNTVGITVDSGFNAYVTGSTNSPSFPTTTGARQRAFAGGASDAFLSKLAFDGGSLAYSTLLGGTGDDSGYRVAVDAGGNALVTGVTRSKDFPVSPGVARSSNAGDSAAFVAKLSPNGANLGFSVYLDGNDDDQGNDIAVDSEGNACVVGGTGSTNFPLTPNALAMPGKASFAAKLAAANGAIIYSTYVGGSGATAATGVAADAAGACYATGWTESTDFPVTAGAVQSGNAGARDVFVAKISPLGSITGVVTDSAGAGLGNVTVALTGAKSVGGQTDANGNFAFYDLADGGYTVTPTRANFRFTPPSQTFSTLTSAQVARFRAEILQFEIAGKVADGSGRGVAAVTITLSGGQTGTAQTDASGAYVFKNLTANGTYTVAAVKAGFAIVPDKLTFENLTANQTANFTALPTYKISGKVTGPTGAGMIGVTLAISGGMTATATTDAAGAYSFPVVPSGSNYTVAASRTSWTFTPANRSFTNLNGDQAADFTAVLATGQSELVIADRKNKAIYRFSNRQITKIANVGTCPTAVAPDSAGNFLVADPCTKSIISVTSAGVVTTLVAGAPLQTPYAIAVDATGDVFVTDNTTSIIYRIALPSRAISEFATLQIRPAPNAQNVGLAFASNGDLISANDDGNGRTSVLRIAPDGKITSVFLGTGIESSGGVSIDGNGIFFIADYKQRVVTRLEPGKSPGAVVTGDGVCCNLSGIAVDAAGNIIVTLDTATKLLSVSPNGAITSLVNGPPLFEPAGIAIVGGITATPSIAGRVLEIDGTPASGLTVTLAGGLQPVTARTDAGGYFFFRNLVAGNNYKVTPSRANSAFVLTNGTDTFENLISNKSLGFRAAVIFSISGRVADSAGTGVQGVSVNASGSANAGAQTDASGVYTLKDLPAGSSVTITASKTGLIITPTAISISNLNKNETGVNFIAGQPAQNGDLVVIDRRGKAAYRFAPGGRNVSPLATLSGCPAAAAADSTGNVFVADPCTKAIYRVTAAGVVTTYFSGDPLSSPIAVAVDIAGAIYVGDNARNFIYRIGADGKAGEFARLPLQSTPGAQNIGLVFSAAGDLIAANDDGNLKSEVIKVAPDGKVTVIYTGPAIESASAVAIDAAGNYIVTDPRQKAISRVTPDGRTAILVSDVCCALAGLVFDPVSGNLLATLDTATKIISITPGGVVSTIVNGPPLSEPTGLTILSTGAANPAISGRIVDATGAAVVDVTMTLTGGAQPAATKSDGSGNYSFRNLTAGGNYTVTPSKTGLGFSPLNAAFSNLTSNQTANFTGGNVFAISGRVIDGAGAGLLEVTITLSSGPSSVTAQTDVNGNYSFPSVFAGNDYTVSPSKTGLLFSPANISVTRLSRNSVANFIGGSAATLGDFIVSDRRGKAIFRISPSTRIPNPIAAVGECPAGIATDASGNIYVADPCARGIFRVTGGGAVTPLFIGTPLVSPVAVTLDIAGNLIVADNDLNQILSIAPETKAVTVLAKLPLQSSASSTVQNMALAYDNNGELVVANDSGTGRSEIIRIKQNGDIVNVLTGTSIASTGALVIESSGNYLVADYRERQLFRVTPAGVASVVAGALGNNLSGLALDPVSGNIIATLDNDSKVISITPNGTTVSNIVSQSQLLTPTGIVVLGVTGGLPGITGRVTDPGGAPLADLLMTLSGASSATTRTDVGGNYSFRGLTSGGTYTVTPSRTGFQFVPPSITFENLNRPQLANFRGGAAFDITVRVIDAAGGPVSGARVELTGVAPIVTDNSGTFTFRSIPGGTGYEVSASKEGFIIVPRTQAITNLSSNATITFTVGVPPSPGDYLVADRKAKTIVRISSNGRSANPIASLGTCPSGVAVDGAGVIWAIDPCTKTLFRVTLTGFAQSIFVGDPLVHPTAIATDAAGNVFIADNGTNSIFKYTPNTVTLPAEFGRFQLKSPTTAQNMGLTFDANGDLIAACDDGSRSEILRFKPDGTRSVIYSGSGIQSAAGIAIDGTGNFIVADYVARVFARLNAAGSVSVLTSAGGNPAGVIFDSVTRNIVGSLDQETRIVNIGANATPVTLIQGPPLTEPVGLAIYRPR